jgi:hypothetical protein
LYLKAKRLQKNIAVTDVSRVLLIPTWQKVTGNSG